jgi:hypothetical protein
VRNICHSRAGGKISPIWLVSFAGGWIPACAGMTVVFFKKIITGMKIGAYLQSILSTIDLMYKAQLIITLKKFIKCQSKVEMSGFQQSRNVRCTPKLS